MKEYLVEIRLKDWIAGANRVIAYEEVIAVDDYFALHAGFNQFVRKTEHSPVTRRYWQALNLSYTDICAADCVQLD